MDLIATYPHANRVLYSLDGEYFSVISNIVEIYNRKNRELCIRVENPIYPTSVAFSDDSKLVAVLNDVGTVCVCSLADKSVVAKYCLRYCADGDVVFNDLDQIVVCGSNGGIYRIDLKSNENVTCFKNSDYQFKKCYKTKGHICFPSYQGIAYAPLNISPANLSAWRLGDLARLSLLCASEDYSISCIELFSYEMDYKWKIRILGTDIARYTFLQEVFKGECLTCSIEKSYTGEKDVFSLALNCGIKRVAISSTGRYVAIVTLDILKKSHKLFLIDVDTKNVLINKNYDYIYSCEFSPDEDEFAFGTWGESYIFSLK